MLVLVWPVHGARDSEADVLRSAHRVVGAGSCPVPDFFARSRSTSAARHTRVLASDHAEACASNQGTTFEAMNLAAVWKLPLVLLCENNLYSEMTPIRETSSVDSMVKRGVQGLAFTPDSGLLLTAGAVAGAAPLTEVFLALTAEAA